MKKSTNETILGIIIIGIIILSFFAGKKYQRFETQSSGEYISIHQYNELSNHLAYLHTVERAYVYIAYQLHHDIEIDPLFFKYASTHIWVPDDRDLDKYIVWEEASPTQTPYDLVRFMDSTIANWYESIPFMFMDEDHDSTWVYNSDSYIRGQDAVVAYRTREYK